MDTAAKAAILLALSAGAPVRAEVVATSEAGFALRYAASAPVSAEAAWAAMVRPAAWWDPAHTYSGEAARLSMVAEAGGCFCEAMPTEEAGAAAVVGSGSVEHMRVVQAMPGRLLRLSGALGPLQSEALSGVLTATFEPAAGGGTQIVWEYVVGGYMRRDPAQVAPAVDAVMATQHARLVAHLGAR